MKRIYVTLGIILFPSIISGYVITNSPQSRAPAWVILTKHGEPLLGAFPFGGKVNKAQYFLKPGKKGSWNQQEIRKKLKQEHLNAWLIERFSQHAYQKIELGDIPINANLMILLVHIDGNIVGGAIDQNTGKIYNPAGYEQARKYIEFMKGV